MMSHLSPKRVVKPLANVKRPLITHGRLRWCHHIKLWQTQASVQSTSGGFRVYEYKLNADVAETFGTLRRLGEAMASSETTHNLEIFLELNIGLSDEDTLYSPEDVARLAKKSRLADLGLKITQTRGYWRENEEKPLIEEPSVDVKAYWVVESHETVLDSGEFLHSGVKLSQLRS